MTFTGFDDLNDLDGGFDARAHRRQQQNLNRAADEAAAVAAGRPAPTMEQVSKLFTQRCASCRGTGRFISYSGRDCGPCFKCKGNGTLSFKTSPEARSKAKQAGDRRKARDEELKQIEVQAFLDANPTVAAFLKQDWEFPRSLHEALHKWGSLTEGQLAAIERCVEKQAARDAERAAQRAAEPASAGLDLSKVPSGLYAVPGGETRLKLRIKQGAGKWAGWTFVDDGAAYGQGTKYGSQRPGATYRGKCEEALAAIAADPRAAAAAYGHLTGTCGMCGRHLEDPVSIANGIGPICASKFAG